MNNVLKHGFFEVTFVGSLDKCLSQTERLTEEYNQLYQRIEKRFKSNQRLKIITIIIGIVAFLFFGIGTVLKWKLLVLSVICFVCIIACMAAFNILFIKVNPAGIPRKEYEYYKNGLSYYIKDKMGNKLQIYEALKNNKVRGVIFKNINKDINQCDIIFCIENVGGIISNANIDSVPIHASVKEQYKNKIELNLEKDFEITYFYRDSYSLKFY